MGIQGLLQKVKDVTTPRHIKEYEGMTVAVDTYAWLHRIIKGSCSKQLSVSGGMNLSDRFVRECISRIYTIQKMGVKVIMVFDGGRLSSKSGEEQNRKNRRQECLQKARDLSNQGNDQAAQRKMAQALDITPQLAQRVVVQLQQQRIPFIVAPYQADAQLAYLSRKQIVDVVVTEDSDLLAYGAHTVLYKLDPSTFRGEEIKLQNLVNCEELNTYMFSHNMFLSACIMSGCDYLPRMPGIGIKHAFSAISRNKTFKKAIAQFRSKGKVVPPEYEQGFVRAFLTFRFQIVYCPQKKKCVMVNDVDIEEEIKKTKQMYEKGELSSSWQEQILDPFILQQIMRKDINWEFIGRKYDDKVAREIAQGIINPVTLAPYEASTLYQHKYYGGMDRGLKAWQKSKQDYTQMRLGDNFIRHKKQSTQLQVITTSKSQSIPTPSIKSAPNQEQPFKMSKSSKVDLLPKRRLIITNTQTFDNQQVKRSQDDGKHSKFSDPGSSSNYNITAFEIRKFSKNKKGDIVTSVQQTDKTIEKQFAIKPIKKNEVQQAKVRDEKQMEEKVKNTLERLRKNCQESLSLIQPILTEEEIRNPRLIMQSRL